MVSSCRGRYARWWHYLLRFLANPWSVSSGRILCKHDKIRWQMRWRHFYCLCARSPAAPEPRIWSSLTPHCVLSRIWFYEALNLRLRSRAGDGIKPTLGASLRQTLLSPAIHGEARSAKILRVKWLWPQQSIDGAITQIECRSGMFYVYYSGLHEFLSGCKTWWTADKIWLIIPNFEQQKLITM